jgi:iturin family lipopeptide synthetase A
VSEKLSSPGSSIRFSVEQWRSLVSQEITQVTGISKIGLEQTFMEMGIESLQAVSIIVNLNKKIDLPVPTTLLFDYPTVKQLAHYLWTSHQPETSAATAPIRDEVEINSEPLAIIGMSCNFPGAPNLDAFWKLLTSEKDAIASIPMNRWDTREHPGVPPFAGLIDRIAEFDNDAFGVSDLEALHLDPQHRLLLESTWLTLEDAGYAPSSLRGEKIGVFIGISSNDYTQLGLQSGTPVGIFDATGNSNSLASNRLSYFFDWKGPSFSVDSACSSSLVALHQAIRSLRLGEIDSALVGGVNAILTPEISTAFSQAGMLAADGRCKTFSAKADGYVRGEGVGTVLIKRLADAIRDQDQIWALVRGSAVNQDGKSNGLTAPNGPAQTLVIEAALKDSKVDRKQIAYVEAHGTGTALGDPIEFFALSRAIGDRAAADPCWVGSVKTNIGHLEAAAGIASLIKTSLSLHHRLILKSLHFETVNPQIGEQVKNIAVSTQARPWAEGKTRLAGLSSFGFGGTNAHAILEGYDPRINASQRVAPKPERFLLFASASDSHSLKELARNYFETLPELSPEIFSDFCHASFQHRFDLNHRVVFQGESKENVLMEISHFLNQQETLGYATARTSRLSSPKTAFLFTGQGSQWSGMGVELYQKFPTFRSKFENCCQGFARHFKEDLYEVIRSKDARMQALLNQTDYGQAALFSLEVSLHELMVREFGIFPAAVFGHSLGEISAAVAAGACSLDDGITLVAARGRLMQKTSPGKMMAVCTDPENARSEISGFEKIEIAAFNGPHLVVLSGDSTSIESVQAKLIQKNIRTVLLNGNHAFHSSLMDPILSEFESAAELNYHSPKIPLVSSLTGKFFSNSKNHDAPYWKRHLREPTQFTQAMQSLKDFGVNGILEIGPHPTLVSMAEACWPDTPLATFSLLDRKHPATEIFAHGLAKLAASGHWLPKYPSVKSMARALPKTVFQKKEFWPARSDSILRKEFATHNPSEVLHELQDLMGRLLKVDRDHFPINDQLINLGADSLLLLNAIQEIKERYQVAIAISDIFSSASTLKLMADFIVQQMKARPLPGQPIREGHSPISVQKNSSTPKGVLGNFKKQIDSTHFLPSKDELKSTYLKQHIEAFSAKTKKSKAHTERYRFPLADNRTSAGFRPDLKEITYPIVFKEAHGSRFKDLDGNEYLDFSMGFGVNLFGHSPRFIEDAIQSQLKDGMAVGPQSELAGKVAELACEMTGLERMAFCNSGTEAVMTAMRLARAATGSETIVIFEGAYHGHFDGVLGRSHSNGQSMPIASGISQSFVENLIVLEYGTDETLETIRKLAPHLAAVLVEPVQSRQPELQPQKFLQSLRQITENAKAALIFDEVITGFRIHTGGSQNHFGVKADLAAYGKILGGGLPIGAVAGSARFMGAIDGGMWSFGDASYPEQEMTFFAGTFSKHPLTMAAAQAVLLKLKQEGGEILDSLNQKTKYLADELNSFFTSSGLDLRVHHFASLFRFKSDGNLDLFFSKLNLAGVYVWEGRTLFLATVHTPAEIDQLIQTVKQVTLELVQVGFLNPSSSLHEKPLLSAQKRFRDLTLGDAHGEVASHICLSVKMKGELSIPLLEKALAEVLEFYDAFRLRFDLLQETQWFHPTLEVKLKHQDFRDFEMPWTELDRDLYEQGKVPFDLKNESPIRLCLYQMVPETAVLSIVAHHIALDGWSFTQFLEEIAEAYTVLEKNESFKLPKTLSFKEFLNLPERLGSPEKRKSAEIYWQQQFDQASPKLIMFPHRDATNPSLRGKRFTFDLEYVLYKKVKKISHELKVTPLVILLAAFSKLMHKIDAQNEFTIGVPAPNREAPGAERLVGNCANLLPIQIRNLNGTPDLTAIQKIKDELFLGFQNMMHPYESLKEALGKKLFNVTFNIEPSNDLPDFGEVSLFVYPFPVDGSEFDLSMNLTDLEYFYHGEIDFRMASMGEDEVLQWIKDFKLVVANLLKSLETEIKSG